MTFRCRAAVHSDRVRFGGVASGPIVKLLFARIPLRSFGRIGRDPFTDAFGIVALMAMTR